MVHSSIACAHDVIVVARTVPQDFDCFCCYLSELPVLGRRLSLLEKQLTYKLEVLFRTADCLLPLPHSLRSTYHCVGLFSC